MSSEIKVGSIGECKVVVQSDNTIVLGNNRQAEVFATPSMILLMEYAARDALAPFLEPHEESVGIDVQVQHLAATPPGNEVKAIATVTDVKKNIVSFEIEAHDPWEKIGSGRHQRAIIETTKLSDKVTPKRTATPTNVASQPAIDLSSINLSSLEFFQVNRQDRLMQIVLSRPDKKNAICEKMTHELALLVEWLQQNEDHVTVVIFSGSGDNFSTGDDVSELDPNDSNKMRQLSLLRGAIYMRLANLPQVTIAAIDGFALGGGFVFAASCDLRIATYNSKVGLPEVSLGWPPNYGVEIVRSCLGRSTAIHWSTTGSQINATKAKDAGFIQQVVSRNQLNNAALELANKILANGPAAVGAVKRINPLDANQSDAKTMDAKTMDAMATDEFLKCLQSEHAQRSFDRFSK